MTAHASSRTYTWDQGAAAELGARHEQQDRWGIFQSPDQQGLLEWYGHFQPAPPLVLVHGEDKAREALAGEIGERYGAPVELARPGMVLDV